jgi:hypothetical protein
MDAIIISIERPAIPMPDRDRIAAMGGYANANVCSGAPGAKQTGCFREEFRAPQGVRKSSRTETLCFSRSARRKRHSPEAAAPELKIFVSNGIACGDL